MHKATLDALRAGDSREIVRFLAKMIERENGGALGEEEMRAVRSGLLKAYALLDAMKGSDEDARVGAAAFVMHCVPPLPVEVTDLSDVAEFVEGLAQFAHRVARWD